VGLASHNDAVVCACIRVLAALLQAELGLSSIAAAGSKAEAAGHSCQGWQEQQFSSRSQDEDQQQQQQQLDEQLQQQQQEQQAQDAQRLQIVTNSIDMCPDPRLSEPAEQPINSGASEELQLQSSSSSGISWQELLQLLLAAAAGPGSSAGVWAAALQELRQLLLHLADAMVLPAAAAASGVTESSQQGECSSSSSRCKFAAAKEALLCGVLPLALAALQEEQQELRRWAEMCCNA
jgi:hypothetical protein